MAQVVSVTNTSRRNFLRLLALGSGVFVLGGFFSKLNASKGSKNTSLRGSRYLSKFRTLERDNEIAFLDKQGNEFIIIEKDVM